MSKTKVILCGIGFGGLSTLALWAVGSVGGFPNYTHHHLIEYLVGTVWAAVAVAFFAGAMLTKE